MRVAVPIWAGHVSPVLDVAKRVRLLQVGGGEILSSVDVEMPLTGRVKTLVHLGVDVMICGAVSSQLENRLRECGCDVVHEICGSVDEVVSAFLDGRLGHERFAMPGCSRQPSRGSDGRHQSLEGRVP